MARRKRESWDKRVSDLSVAVRERLAYMRGKKHAEAPKSKVAGILAARHSKLPPKERVEKAEQQSRSRRIVIRRKGTV